MLTLYYEEKKYLVFTIKKLGFKKSYASALVFRLPSKDKTMHNNLISALLNKRRKITEQMSSSIEQCCGIRVFWSDPDPIFKIWSHPDQTSRFIILLFLQYLSTKVKNYSFISRSGFFRDRTRIRLFAGRAVPDAQPCIRV